MLQNVQHLYPTSGLKLIYFSMEAFLSAKRTLSLKSTYYIFTYIYLYKLYVFIYLLYIIINEQNASCDISLVVHIVVFTVFKRLAEHLSMYGRTWEGNGSKKLRKPLFLNPSFKKLLWQINWHLELHATIIPHQKFSLKGKE